MLDTVFFDESGNMIFLTHSQWRDLLTNYDRDATSDTSNANIERLIKSAIEKGKWTLTQKGHIEIYYKYKKRTIVVRGTLNGKNFNVGTAFVKE